MLLVTGSAGMAGWHIIREALNQGIDVQGIWHCERPCGFSESAEVALHRLDLTDYSAVRRLVEDIRPHAIVHCAGCINVDGCEEYPEQTLALNAEASGVLARAAAGCHARFVHFSTDSVYDGSRGFWKESDPTGPVNMYAKSKVAGEERVLAAHPGAVLLRTNFYGKHPHDARGLASWILSRLQEGQEVPGFTDIVFSPLWIGHLARFVLRLALEPALAGVAGPLNLVSGEAVSKYEFARRLAEVAGYAPSRVVPSESSSVAFKARRPLDTSLDVTRALELFGSLPSSMEGIRDFVNDLDGAGSLNVRVAAPGCRVQPQSERG